MLDVHLVHDARVRRNHLEVVERALAPSEECVAFAVARKLEFGIQRECVRPSKIVDLN
jgi:hypothetical protein